MFKNYLLIAWRQILKNKLYAAINTLGLTLGLSIFVFGMLMVDYEQSHDSHWKNADRIYSISTFFSPQANIGVNETFGTFSAFAPFIDREISEIEYTARTITEEFLVSHDNRHFYEEIRFADPGLTRIFDFEYVEGDETAIDDPTGVIITTELATKYFGSEVALGKTLTLDHNVPLRVTAIVRKPPPSTHFTSNFIGSTDFTAIAPLAALNTATGYSLDGNFNNLSSSDFTYVLIPPDKDRAWLQANIDGIYERHYPDKDEERLDGLNVRPIGEANTLIWDAANLPVLEAIQLLGFLVLVVAIVNYTNLATAQSMSRVREIGLRKTMGASRRQLTTQFLVESTCIAAFAMLVAIAGVEVMVPVFNNATGRGMSIDYLGMLPWLAVAVVVVGVVAGAYPARMISRSTPIEALRAGGKTGSQNARFRTGMLILQFSISIFMLAMVMVMYFQNQKIEESSNIYPKSQIITLTRLGIAPIQEKMETLRNELLNLPGIDNVSFSSQVPYIGNNSAFDVTRERGDETQAFLLTQVVIDDRFLDTYEIEILAGRGLSRDIAADSIKAGVFAGNVILNELALQKFGFGSADDAVGKVFYDVSTRRQPRAYTVVGVFPNQNFRGFHNSILPTAFLMQPQQAAQRGPDSYRYASIRVQGDGLARTLDQIENVWDRIIDDYPLQAEFLEDTFGETYVIYTGMTMVFVSFAVVAFTLSLVGLFGLAAFLATARTKEIGIRKVMGARLGQVVRLLVWQFSKPVLWSLPIALPLAYLAARQYLTFFAGRLDAPSAFIAAAGLIGVVVAWAIVGVHAVRIGQRNPIYALRYE